MKILFLILATFLSFSSFANQPLLDSVKNRDIERVKIHLKDPNVIIDYKDRYGWTPLDWAFYLESNEIVRILVDNGASMTSTSLEGLDALSWTIKKENKELFYFLINKGAKIEWWHLMEAIEWGKTDMALILMGEGSDVNYINPGQYRTPLILAALTGNKKVFHALLEYGAIPSRQIRNETGNSVYDILRSICFDFHRYFKKEKRKTACQMLRWI